MGSILTANDPGASLVAGAKLFAEFLHGRQDGGPDPVFDLLSSLQRIGERYVRSFTRHRVVPTSVLSEIELRLAWSQIATLRPGLLQVAPIC